MAANRTWTGPDRRTDRSICLSESDVKTLISQCSLEGAKAALHQQTVEREQMVGKFVLSRLYRAVGIIVIAFLAGHLAGEKHWIAEVWKTLTEG